MSAFALSALGLANRASQSGPALFAALPERAIPAGIDRIASSGFAEEGVGAASYVSDSRCTPDLLAAHPRFAFRTANGRVFRLLPERNSIAVEQGGAVGGGNVDDQPAVQATIAYAEAVGAGEVRFEQALYRVDCPERTSPESEKFAEDGHPLVVRASLALRGAAAERTALDFRAMGGGDPELQWQSVPTSPDDATPMVWRGGGLFVRGDIADPGDGPRTIARLELDRLIFKGNRKHTGAYAFPADPVTGDGWDTSDRAFWLQDTYAGDLVFRETDMIGWKGEIVYLAGEAHAVRSLDLDRCYLATGNGSALNPSVDAVIRARDCRFGDCFQAQEDVAKTRASYANCEWFDCDHMGLGSGPCAPPRYNPAWPSRDEDATPPQTLLTDCTFRNIRSLSIGSWVRGTIRTVDTTINLDGNKGMALRDTDLVIDALLDRAGSIHALAFDGVSSLTEQVPGAPAGTFKQPPTQVRVRIAQHRTKLAEQLGHQWLGCYWTGYIARDCALHASGEVQGGRLPNGGATPLSMPRVTYTDGETTTAYWPRGWYRLPDIDGTTQLVPTAPAMTVELTQDVVADITLARIPGGGRDYGYADGQRIRLVKQNNRGTMRFVKGASDGTRMTVTRELAGEHDWIEFIYNRDWERWEESGFFSAT